VTAKRATRNAQRLGDSSAEPDDVHRFDAVHFGVNEDFPEPVAIQSG